MLLAGQVPLDDVLARLASLRPAFHSEADLQQALAWEARVLDPSLWMRLETRPEPGVRLDLLLTGDDSAQTAVELKYLVRLWKGDVGGERFELKNQSAQDIRAYGVVKDIVRVERFVARRPGSNGAVVCLANDSSYWRAPGHGRETNARAFRIHEGTVLEDRVGTADWRGQQQGQGGAARPAGPARDAMAALLVACGDARGVQEPGGADRRAGLSLSSLPRGLSRCSSIPVRTRLRTVPVMTARLPRAMTLPRRSADQFWASSARSAATCLNAPAGWTLRAACATNRSCSRH